MYQAIAEGRVQLEPGVGKIDCDRADAEWINPTQPGAGSAGPTNHDLQRLLLQANANRALWKSRREELLYQRESKQLEENIRLAGAAHARRTQEKLLAVPARAAAKGAMKPRAELERIVLEEIRLALAELGDVEASAPRPRRKGRPPATGGA